MRRKARPLEELVRNRLRQLRRNRGLTQEALSELAEVSVDAVNRIENGTRVPTLNTLERLAAALKVSPADLISEGELPPAEHAPEVVRIAAMLEGRSQRVRKAAADLVSTLVRVAGE